MEVVHMRRKLFIVSSLTMLLLGSLAHRSRADIILDPLRDFLVQTVTRFVSKSLNGTLEVGSLRGSLLSTPTLHDIVLRDAQGNILGQIAEIRLAYDLTTLLKKRLTVRQVEIIRPQVTLVQEPDGSINLGHLFKDAAPQADPPEAGGLPFALVLENVQLRDGQLTLQFPALPGIRTLEGLQVHLQGQLDQAGMRGMLHRLAVHAQPADVEIRALRGGFQALATGTHITDLRLRTANTLLTINGALPGRQQVASLDVQVQPLDLTEIGRLLQNDTLHGELRLVLQAEGPADALMVRSQLWLGDGEVELQGQVDTVATPLRYTGTLALRQLDLAAVVSRAALQSDLNVHGRVEAEGLHLNDLRGQVTLEIQPSHIGDIVLRPSQIHLEAQPQRIQVRQFQLDTSLARLLVNGGFDLAGRSEVQYQLLADVSQVRQLLGTERVAGDVEVHGQIEGEHTTLRTHGTLLARGLQYQEHRLQTLQVQYDGRDLWTQPQGTAQVVAQQAQVGTLPVEQFEVQAAYHGEQRQVQFTTRVKQSATDGGSMRGLVTLREAGPQIIVEEMEFRLANRPWRATAPINVALEAGNVFIHTFKLAHAEESLDISGALVNEQLQDVRVHLQRLDLQALRRLLPVPALVGDRATLQASLSGTFAEPRLQAEVLLEPQATAGVPRQRLFTTLSYQDKQLESATRLGQAERDVLTLTLQLPVDLALTGLSMAQRLQEAPVAVHLGIERPDLVVLRRWVTVLPELSGTIQGEVTLQGLPQALDIDTTLRVQRLRMPGVIEEVSTPLRLTASVVTAPTLAGLVQALSQGEVALEINKLVVQAPTVRAQLPGQGTLPPPILVDNLLVQADARLNRAGIQADLHALQLQAVAFDLPRTALTMAGRLTPQHIDLTSLHVRLPQSEVRGKGTFHADGQRIQATVDIPRLRLDELPLQLPADLPPEVQGTVTIQGSVPAPQVTARLQYATAQVMADVTAQLQQPLPQYRATLQVERFPIARLMPGTSGLFQVQLQAQGAGFAGPQRRADLDLQVTAPDFALAPNLATRLRASVAGDSVQLTQLQVQSVPLTFDARGALSAARQVDLDYTATLGNLQALRDVLGVAMQAQGRLTGEVRGQLEALQTRGTLQLDTWSVADFQGTGMRATFSATGLPGTPQATLSARLPELQGPSLPASALDLQGAWQARQGTFSVAVTAGPYEKTRLAGKAVLQEDMRLTLERLRLQRQDLAWENAAPVEVVREAQGTLRLTQLLLRSGEQEISARATLRPAGTVDGTVQMRQVHVLSTMKAFDPAAAGPDGRLAADMVVRGALQQPEIDGTVALTALRWQEQPLGDMHAWINLAGETLHTDVRWQDRDQELLHLFGTVNTGTPTTLALQVQMSDVDLARLKPLSPAVRQSAGALNADLRVTGTPQQPLVHGTMRLRDGIMLLAATGERYKDIAASLVFDGDRLEIQRFHVGSRSGVLQVEGWVTSSGLALQQLDMTIQAEKFTALHTPDMEAMLTGNIAVHGSRQDLEATGNITVPRARIRLGGILGGGPADVEPRELTVEGVYGPGVGVVVETDGGTPVIQKQVPLPFLRADLTLEIPRNTWVQGPNTAVEMRGNMRVTKALEQPFILDGTVETVRGFASFYGKKFTVQEGKVVFPGTEEINPFLDVWVTHAVSGYDVSIKVGGKAKQPALTLSSVPELPQADIVSLLVVGKTMDRLTNSEQNSLASQAQQLVGGAAANELEEALGKPLGLDTIELEAGKEIGTGSVSVGRYVTQDIFLSYEQELGGKGSHTVGIEYSINRRLKLKGSGSDTGESALDLLWRHDY
jgi:autotransporter translocation and assembly factor TamB